MNKSLTSQGQWWGKPSSTSGKLHEPDLIENIKIQKVKGNALVEELVSASKRFQYDPRTPALRLLKTIHDYDFDALADISDGDSSVLLYTPRIPHPSLFHTPDMYNIHHTEEVATSFDAAIDTIPIISDLIKQKPGMTIELFNIELHQKLAVNPDVQTYIECKTRGQSTSTLWCDMRIGRITASKILACSDAVDPVSGDIRRCTSTLKDVMGYTEPFSSPATSWGRYHEATARAAFFKKEKKGHRNLLIEDCGVFVSTQCPIVAASPDGMVSCDCHPRRILEIKNPWKCRNETITNYAKSPESCLICDCVGFPQLKSDHTYYAQMQTQMFCTGCTSRYLCVKTHSANNNLFIEEVLYDDEFMEHMLARVHYFFNHVIIPELLNAKLFDKVTNDICAKVMHKLISCIEEDDHKTSTSIPQLVSPSTALYPFGTCHKECPDEPVDTDHMSIQCDECMQWFHWHCVGIAGNEICLNNKRVKWYCPKCFVTGKGPRARALTKGKSNRKGKGKC